MPENRPLQGDLARYIDHSKLSPSTTRQEITKLCSEARELGCAAVCVNPSYVTTAALECEGSDVRVCSVVAFPTGAHHTRIKMEEASRAVGEGAVEVDLVANHGLLLDDNLAAYAADIRAVRQAIGTTVTLKVIIEASKLNDESIVRAAIAAELSGADFVKTSTGVYGQARVNDVVLLRQVLQQSTRIKAAGGITSADTARAFIAAGADRLGMSGTVNILTGK